MLCVMCMHWLICVRQPFLLTSELYHIRTLVGSLPLANNGQHSASTIYYTIMCTPSLLYFRIMEAIDNAC